MDYTALIIMFLVLISIIIVIVISIVAGSQPPPTNYYTLDTGTAITVDNNDFIRLNEQNSSSEKLQSSDEYSSDNSDTSEYRHVTPESPTNIDNINTNDTLHKIDDYVVTHRDNLYSQSTSQNTMQTQSRPSNAMYTPITSQNIANPIQIQNMSPNAIQTQSISSNTIQTNAIQTQSISSNTIRTNPMQSNPIQTQSISLNVIQTQSTPTNPIQTQSTPTNPIQTQSTLTNAMITNNSSSVCKENLIGLDLKRTDISRNACNNKDIGFYNMSVRKMTNGYSGVIRGSTWNGCCAVNSGPIFSYAYSIQLNNNGTVKNLDRIGLDYKLFDKCVQVGGIEDPRLFIFRNEEWIICNCLGLEQQPNVCANAMCIFKLSDPNLTFKLLKPPSNIYSQQRQKNWSPFEYNGDLYCEYSITPHVILKIDVNTGLTEEKWSTGSSKDDVASDTSLRGGAPPIHVSILNGSYISNIDNITRLDVNNTWKQEQLVTMTKSSEEAIGRSPGWRGEPHLTGLLYPPSIPQQSKTMNINQGPILNLPGNEKEFYLGIGHSRTSSTSDYLHFFYIFKASPPFNIIKKSIHFKLDGSERIQFVTGLSLIDNMIYVSYGVDDCYNRISIFHTDTIIPLLT